ncbi:YkvA family protein [Neobacillus sp. LXY-4]|uniref:YkvA family protein n=1 Tax=Neobacillus sp. LXY-4 TaxID=3379826 RepID=UPI003EE2EF94
MLEHEQDFYQNFRKKMKYWEKNEDGRANKYVEFLMFGPDLFHLLCKLTVDDNVSVTDKAKLGAAIAYFISPVDFIPEVLVGPVGYIDDIAVAAYVLNSMINKADPEIVKKHWAGEGDVLEIIKKIIATADQMVGSGIMKKIKGKFGA